MEVTWSCKEKLFLCPVCLEIAEPIAWDLAGEVLLVGCGICQSMGTCADFPSSSVDIYPTDKNRRGEWEK